MRHSQKSALAISAAVLCIAAGYAMRGQHGPTGNVGLLGTEFAGVQGVGPLRGVLGQSTGTDSTGVQGEGPFTGVFGYSTSTTVDGIGVYGAVSDTAPGTGVWGRAVGNGGDAGYFEGRVRIFGTLFKSAGAFRIDHPLDPANKYLSHSFVESPEMMNIYDGVATLDGEGAAIVSLPDWFEALNRDFRYQLTCIGENAPVYIADEISGNAFKIAGGHGGMKVSWQVTGRRQDPYAVAHPIQVEEWKDRHERGRFTHPELYGRPPTEAISAERTAGLKKRALGRNVLPVR